MPRVKGGNRRLLRRKKLTKQTKGFFGRRKNVFRHAAETLVRGLQFGFRDRRQKKRHFRRLWAIRISAALTGTGLSYSRLIDGLKKSNCAVNRKVLSELAIHNPDVFSHLVKLAQKIHPAKQAA